MNSLKKNSDVVLTVVYFNTFVQDTVKSWSRSHMWVKWLS